MHRTISRMFNLWLCVCVIQCRIFYLFIFNWPTIQNRIAVRFDYNNCVVDDKTGLSMPSNLGGFSFIVWFRATSNGVAFSFFGRSFRHANLLQCFKYMGLLVAKRPEAATNNTGNTSLNTTQVVATAERRNKQAANINNNNKKNQQQHKKSK